MHANCSEEQGGREWKQVNRRIFLETIAYGVRDILTRIIFWIQF